MRERARKKVGRAQCASSVQVAGQSPSFSISLSRVRMTFLSKVVPASFARFTVSRAETRRIVTVSSSMVRLICLTNHGPPNQPLGSRVQTVSPPFCFHSKYYPIWRPSISMNTKPGTFSFAIFPFPSQSGSLMGALSISR